MTARFEAHPEDIKNVHRLWGAWYWHPKGPDLERARAVVTRAIEHDHSSDPTLVARLAETDWALGEHSRALRTLERAARMPGRSSASPLSLAGQLDRWRRAVGHDLPTFASIDAALERHRYETILPEGETWRFWGSREPPSPGVEWTQLVFDDSDWKAGPSGFGFGDGDDRTEIVDMQGYYTSLFIRRVVELDDSALSTRFLLNLRVDDGCVAFVNGTEIGRVRVEPGPVPEETLATKSALKPLVVETLSVEPGVLVPGRNVIAILGVNTDLGSSDFTLAPSLARELRDPSRAWRKVLESFRTVAGDDAALRIAYLEARILEAGGQYHEAAARLQPIARETPGESIVLLALARCLERMGDPEAASAALRRGIEREQGKGPPVDREVLDAWLRLELNRSSPEELVAVFPPADEPGLATDPLADPPPTTFAEDVRWLLERQLERFRKNRGDFQPKSSGRLS